MPKNYNNSICKKCPYYKSLHLECTKRPLSLENNKSDTLLVFQNPGVDEWNNTERKPIISKNRYSAANRMRKSFARKKVLREDFDISEAVQCYPGKGKKRDKSPSKVATRYCREHLRKDINDGKYKKIVAFGKIAQEGVIEITKDMNNIRVICIGHPSGRVSNDELDKY